MGNPPLRRLHLPERSPAKPLPSAAEQRAQRLASGRIVILTGGRAYPHRDRVFAALDAVHARSPITLLVHGACGAEKGEMTGADGWAHEWAQERGVKPEPHPANWGMWGKAAGPMRNKQMCELGAHGVVAFRGDRGTVNMLKWALHFGIPAWPAYPAEWTAEELYELFGR